jgi:diaminopimelate epimerase
MTIPFTKCEAAGNDFLVVDWADLSAAGFGEGDLPAVARRMCDRHRGVGADGVEILGPPGPAERPADAFIRLFNSDGSEAEVSGNGTRCVAAYLVAHKAAAEMLRISTLAGLKELRLVDRQGLQFVFDMTMGVPRYREDEIRCTLEAAGDVHEVTLVNVGNPQCVLLVDDFEFDWPRLGEAIEAHPRFPVRTNVSFVQPIDEHSLDVRFWERGAGQTLSSGTGSTGAAVAGILLGKVRSPVRVRTLAGDLLVTWEGDELILQGPATIVARGEYFGPDKSR